MDSRTALIRICTFLGGLYFFLHFILSDALLDGIGIKDAHSAISNGFIVIGAMAIGLGVINLLIGHGSHVVFRKRGWAFSALLLSSLFFTLGVTTNQWLTSRAVSQYVQKIHVLGEFASRIIEDAESDTAQKSYVPSGLLPPLDVRIKALERYAHEIVATVHDVAFQQSSESTGAYASLLVELQEGERALLEEVNKIKKLEWSILTEEHKTILGQISKRAGQYAVSYSIARRNDVERGITSKLYNFLYAGLFENLGAAMFALLGVYIAAAAFRAFRIRSFESTLMMVAALVVMLGQISFGRMLSEDMPAIRQWLLEVPNSAVFRAIRFGAAVAGLMLAIRMWFSIETSRSSVGRK